MRHSHNVTDLQNEQFVKNNPAFCLEAESSDGRRGGSSVPSCLTEKNSRTGHLCRKTNVSAAENEPRTQGTAFFALRDCEQEHGFLIRFAGDPVCARSKQKM